MPVYPGFVEEALAAIAEGKLPPIGAPKEESLVPGEYKAVIKAKLNRDRTSYKAFRDIDEKAHLSAHLARADARVKSARDQVTEDQAAVDQLEAEAAEALSQSRAAEDRAIKATEHARKCREDADKLTAKGVPEVATDALVRLEKAVQVATQADRAADEAKAASDDLQECLAEARDDLAAARIALDAANAAVSVPAGPAPISGYTIQANYAYMQLPEVWDSLSAEDKRRVHSLGKPRMPVSNAEWWERNFRQGD